MTGVSAARVETGSEWVRDRIIEIDGLVIEVRDIPVDHAAENRPPGETVGP
jgi:hypothetical protein